MSSEFVSIARIVKTRGIRGEVVADILTDFPERFASLRKVFLCSDLHQSWEELEDFWFHKNRVILKFADRDLPETARELVGCEVRIHEDQRVELPEDTYYDSELVGCRVVEGSRSLGEVTGILKIGSTVSNLIVSTPEGSEYQIPLVSEFIRRVDLAARTIEVDLPPGLVDLSGRA